MLRSHHPLRLLLYSIELTFPEKEHCLMPELPEVETTCSGIKPHIEGKTVTCITVRNKNLRWPIPEDISQQVADKPVISVRRKAKYILIEFTHGALIVHLGMTGSLRIVSDQEPPAYHDHFDLVLESCIVRYKDPRRFGSLLWQHHPIEFHPLLAHLGPEPLSDEFNAEQLHTACQGRKQPIKALIMDSKQVVGVGNIYANEALFMAGIHPKRHAGKISKKRLQLLTAAIKEVLQHAITQGGTTLRNFVNSSGNPGYFKQQLRVYGRAEKPCLKCEQPLKEIRLGQRSTVFCKHCQR